MKALVAIKKDKTFDTFFTEENIKFAESLGEIVWLDTAVEGLFGNQSTLTDIVFGDQLQTLSPYMFANAGIKANQNGEYRLRLNKVTSIGKSAFRNTGITHLTIPSYVTFIDDHAFAGCESLIEVVFSDCENPVTIGFQSGTYEYGPFYQSPLKHISIAREIVLTDAYAKACDEYDEGVFIYFKNTSKFNLLTITVFN